jgi:predicted RecA/RadA family phage recombinase
MAKYVQHGAVLNYTAENAINYNDIVDLKTRIAVSGSTLAAGETGIIHVEGVYQIAKSTDSGFAIGEAVYYDAENAVITNDNTKTPAGYAAAPAAADDTTVLVKLQG